MLIASTLILNSCGDDFTDNAQVGAISDEQVTSTEAEAEKLIIGLYDKMKFTYSKDWHSAFLVKILPGDDANAGGGSATDQPPLQDIDGHTNISTENGPINHVWTGFYAVIAHANLMIDRLENTGLANADLLIGEAKFMRAWSYLELVTMFGDVPMRTTVVSSVDQFAVAKSPKEDIYVLIEEDLTDAISKLSDKGAAGIQNFRVTKGAAQGLMGKTLVHQAKYDQAVTFFSKLIANPLYDLEADVSDVWMQIADYGVESLFEIGFSSEGGYNWGGGRDIAWGGRNEGNLHVQLMGPRASENNGPGFDVTGLDVINGWGFNLPSAKLITAFDKAGDVERRAATIASEADIIAAGGAVILGDEIWGYEGGIRLKYATRTEDTDSVNAGALNYTTNFKIFRYAEVLLLAAEAYNKNGNDGLALLELNKVRVRAGLAELSGLAGDNLFEVIVDEKFLELAHEGQRFWDLVRWGKASEELAGSGYTPKNDLFPIPLSEINLNALINAENQNPGY